MVVKRLLCSGVFKKRLFLLFKRTNPGVVVGVVLEVNYLLSLKSTGLKRTALRYFYVGAVERGSCVRFKTLLYCNLCKDFREFYIYLIIINLIEKVFFCLNVIE